MLRSKLNTRGRGLVAAPDLLGRVVGTRVSHRRSPVAQPNSEAQLYLPATFRSVAARAAAVAVAPAPVAPPITRGDTTGATMVVDDVWVQV